MVGCLSSSGVTSRKLLSWSIIDMMQQQQSNLININNLIRVFIKKSSQLINPLNIDGQKCSFVGYIEATTQTHIISSEQSMDNTVYSSRGSIDEDESEQAEYEVQQAGYITERNKLTVEIRRRNRSQIFKARRANLEQEQYVCENSQKKVKKIKFDPETYQRVIEFLMILEREEEQTNQCQIMMKINEILVDQKCHRKIFKLFFSEQKISLFLFFCNSTNEQVVEHAALILSQISGQIYNQQYFELFISIPDLLLKWLSNLDMENKKLYKCIILLFGNLCMQKKFIDIFQEIQLEKYLFYYSFKHSYWKGQIKMLECWLIHNYFNGKKRSSLSQNEKDLTALLFYCLVNCDIQLISEPLLDCLNVANTLIHFEDSEITSKLLSVGFIPFVIKHIHREEIKGKEIKQIINLFGNIACRSQISQLITILNYDGVVEFFCQMLKSTVEFQEEILWAISNIVASDQDDIKVSRMVMTNQIIGQVQKTMLSEEPNVRKYTCSIFGHLLVSSTNKIQFIHLLEAAHFYETLCGLIQTDDIKMQMGVIEIINTSFIGLQKTEYIVSFRQHFNIYQGMLLIQSLQMSQSKKVRVAAEKLTDKYGSIICTDRGV